MPVFLKLTELNSFHSSRHDSCVYMLYTKPIDCDRCVSTGM